MKSAIAKHSVTISGRRTSVSLEEAFWKALHEIAHRDRMTLAELIKDIDANRKRGNLSSAIRLFVLDEYLGQLEPPQPKTRRGAVA
jgi:predicted DNA-binding ribbon-helix-helix protein